MSSRGDQVLVLEVAAASSMISVRRGVENFRLDLVSSSRMMSITRSRERRMPRKSAISVGRGR
jgi:hypothetical protein